MKEKKKTIDSEILIRIILILVFIGLVCLVALFHNRATERISYFSHLEDVVVTVDNNDLTMADLAFYIMYYERQVQSQARIYDRKDSSKFWNAHTNHTFIRTTTKDSIIENVIHDEIFYRLALEENLTLDDEDEKALDFFITDFWEDLYDEQDDLMTLDSDVINSQIKKACIAQKYQDKLAKEVGPTFAAYSFDGYYYKQIKDQHAIHINNSLWERLSIGSVTISH